MKKKLAKFIRYFSLAVLISPFAFFSGVIFWKLLELAKQYWESPNWYYSLLFIVPATLAALNWWADEQLNK